MRTRTSMLDYLFSRFTEITTTLKELELSVLPPSLSPPTDPSIIVGRGSLRPRSPLSLRSRKLFRSSRTTGKFHDGRRSD